MGRQKDEKHRWYCNRHRGYIVRQSSICVSRVPEEEDRENDAETIFEE